MSDLTSLDPQLARFIRAHGLRADALAANRAGRLTQEQAAQVRRRRRSARVILAGLAVGCLGMGIWQLRSGVPVRLADRVDPYLMLAGGCFIVLFLVFRGFRNSYAAELEEGRVAMIDGAIGVEKRRTSSAQGGGQVSYYYRLGGYRFPVKKSAAATIDPQKTYRIYFLPMSKTMVNIEPIDASRTAAAHLSLSADEVSAIAGEPMRVGPLNDRRDDRVSVPGMIFNVFESMKSDLHLAVGWMRGGQMLTNYSRVLSVLPGASSVTGLGDVATFAAGKLIVLHGDHYIMVDVVSAMLAREPDRQLELARRVAQTVLNRLASSAEVRGQPDSVRTD